MSSTRKGSRITAYSSLMIIYAIFMIRKAFHFRPSITAFPQYTDEVRILSTTIPHSNAKGTVINDEEEATNFISIFENVLLENVPINSSNSGAKFSALLVKDGKVYCRRSQIKSLSRGKYFVQMLNEGLSLQYHRERAVANNDYHNTGSKKRKLRRRQEPKWQKLVGDDVDVSMLREMKTSNDFPILLKHDDSNGCNPSTRSDKYGFPRMTWSIPSKNAISSESLDDGLQNPWCAAIGVPPYKAWRELQKTNEEKSKEEKRWEATFIENELNYPWSFKRNQAVWRGSTTFNKALYGQLSFLEMPRAKLVEKSRDIPHLIDAGFHKFVGKYEGEKERLINETVFMDPIPLANMMKYKAIIDIDGNNWSARFNELLCMNSVVIKIQPDFVEQFYKDLRPMIHYVPASLSNLTETMEYVVDSRNEHEMKGIVASANAWCRSAMTRWAFSNEAAVAVEMYQHALDVFDVTWRKDWLNARLLDRIDDLVECNA